MNLFKLLLNEWREIEITTSLLPFLFALVGIAPIIGGIPPTTNIFYVMLFGLSFMFFNKKRRIEKVCVIFLATCFISVLFAMPPAFFKSWQRLGLFALVFMIASPIFQSEYLRNFRTKALFAMMKICLIISLISFVFYFLGINFMTYYGETLDVNQVGGFGGLTKQSMLLGPIASFATVYTSYKALATKNWWYWLLAVPCVACTMFAASRSAFIAGLVGLVAMIYVFAKNRRQFVKIMVYLVIIGCISYPFWNSAMSGLEEKQKTNIEKGGITASRDSKWSNRIEEFKSNPVTGVGFCACDVQHTEDYDRFSGTIEGGSSWLVVLSMTGLFGFIPFCILMYRCMKNTYRHKTKESALLVGLLSALLFHFIAESYITAGGSQLCLIAWMVIGCCYDNIYLPKLTKA